MPNRFQPVPPNTDPSQANAIINNNFAQLDNESVSKLFYDANGVPSIHIGVGQDKISRIKVAKPGFDVTSTGDANLSFNSAQNVFKVVSSGTVTVNKPASSEAGQATVTHNLGYVPAVLAYYTDSNQTSFSCLPNVTLGAGASAGMVTINIRYAADSTIFNVAVDTPNIAGGSYSSALTFYVKYFLLQETAN